MIRRISVFAVLTAVGIAIGGPGYAGAATTIGQTFTPTTGCEGDTILQSGSPGAQYAAPSSGVITSWSYQSDASDAPTLRLKVGRASAGADLSTSAEFAITGQSELENTVLNTLNQFPTRISVEQGDVIGFYFQTIGGCADTVTPSGYFDHFVNFVDVQPGPPQTFNREVRHFDVSALLEPDADHDGFGDESQDKCVGTAGPYNGCPNTLTIDSAKQKDKKPKIKVTTTVPGAGTLAAGSANDASLAASAGTSLKAVSQTITSTTRQKLTLTLKLSKSAKKKLASKGKLKAKVKVVYTPTGGPAGSQTRKVKLKD
jgi:hypothetical protein